MSTSKSTIKRERNRRYGKKSKNIPSATPLDRFAGSSEEDIENDGDDVESQQDTNDGDKISADAGESDQKIDHDSISAKSRTNGATDDNTNALEYEGGNESEPDNAEEGDDDDQDNAYAESYDHGSSTTEPQFQLTTGIANVMNRILSAPPSKSKTSNTAGTSSAVVLSKTKTPLQLQAEKEKKMQEVLKESRRAKRERQIKALHVPLTVATNSFVALNSNINPSSGSLTKELEMERMHRRVATRGIVALFNAISHHQVRPEQTAASAASASASATTTDYDAKKTNTLSSSTKLTKNGFLDLIKQKAISSTSLYDAKTPKSVAVSTTSALAKNGSDQNNAKKWNALKDEYMMDSSKNWDELDDGDEDAIGNETRSTHHRQQQPKKKLRHHARS